MIRLKRPLLIALVLLVFATAVGAAAQTTRTTVSGTVRDELGGVLVGASVRVTDGAGQALGNGETGPDGTFRFDLPIEEVYRVTVHNDAFEDANLTVPAGQLARGETLDIVLSVSALVEHVSVEAAPRDQAFATQSPQNPYRVPASATTISQVLTAPQIQALKPVSVFDLVNNTTGSFSTSSGKKGFSGARIRGDSNLIWIVDGAYIPSQVAGRILQDLPVTAIEQMEVVRGASSLTMAPLVGFSNPSGAPTDGFIIIRTKRAQRSTGSARLGYESNATPMASGIVSTTFGAPRVAGTPALGYISGSLNYFDTAGPDVSLANGAPYNVARHSASGLVKAGINQGLFSVDVTYFHDTARFEVPNSSLVATGSPSDNWEMQPSRTDLAVATGSLVWSKRQTTLFALSHNRTHQKLNGSGSVANLNYEDGGLINDNRVTHLNVRHVADWWGYRLSAGSDLMRWHTPTGQNSYEGLERKERIVGVFGQVERSLFGNRLAVDASVRRDQDKILKGIDYFTGGAQPPQPVPLVENRLLAPAMFFTAGARADVTSGFSVVGRAGRNKQSDSNVNPVPGLALAPEVQHKWEVGAEGHLNRLLTATVTAFHRGVSNEKSISGYTFTRNNGTTAVCVTGTIPTAGATAAATSLQPCYTQSDTTRDGMEFILEGGWPGQGHYRAGFTRMTRLSDSANVVQRTTPRNVFDVTVTQGWSLWSITGSVKRVSTFEGRRPAAGTDTAYYALGDYTRTDLSLTRTIPFAGRAYRASVFGRNLGNVHYQSVAGFPDVGRVVGADLTFNF